MRELASSSAASVSSKIMNGGGLTCETAKIKAMEVSARSPPDNISNPLILFFGKLTRMSIPSSPSSSAASASKLATPDGSSKSPASSSNSARFLFFSRITSMLASPPPNIITKYFWNSALIFATPVLNSAVSFSSNSVINSFSDWLDFSKSVISRAKKVSRSSASRCSLIISPPPPAPISSMRILIFSNSRRRSAWTTLDSVSSFTPLENTSPADSLMG